MAILQIEHPITDYETWKKAFDADPVQREASGVRRYRVMRPVDDERFIKVDLEFDDRAGAESFLGSLRDMWASGSAAPALAGGPVTRIVEEVQSEEY